MSDRKPAGARRLELVVRLHELPLLIGLVLLWCMLWREISVVSLVSGIVASLVAMRVFYLPPVELAGRFNAWYALRYLGFLLWRLVVASLQVSWLAIRPGPPPKTAIIGVRLHTSSDFILTLVAITNSLIPGSLVAEVDRYASTLYLHVLDTPTQKQIRLARHEVWKVERLLIMSLGSRMDVERITR